VFASVAFCVVAVNGEFVVGVTVGGIIVEAGNSALGRSSVSPNGFIVMVGCGFAEFSKNIRSLTDAVGGEARGGLDSCGRAKGDDPKMSSCGANSAGGVVGGTERECEISLLADFLIDDGVSKDCLDATPGSETEKLVAEEDGIIGLVEEESSDEARASDKVRVENTCSNGLF